MGEPIDPQKTSPSQWSWLPGGHYGGIDRNLAVTGRKKWWALWFYGQINLPT